MHKGVNYACTHNFKYSISIKIIEFISLAAVGYTVVVHVMDRLDNINTYVYMKVYFPPQTKISRWNPGTAVAITCTCPSTLFNYSLLHLVTSPIFSNCLSPSFQNSSSRPVAKVTSVLIQLLMYHGLLVLLFLLSVMTELSPIVTIFFLC